MKKVIYIFLLFLTFLIAPKYVNAESKVYSNGPYYLVLDKSKCSLYTADSGDKFYQCIIEQGKMPQASQASIYFGDPISAVYFYTNAEDPIFIDEKGDKWWANLYVCEEMKFSFLHFVDEINVGIYTSSMLSKYAPNNDGFWSGLFNGKASKCMTYVVEDVPSDKQVGYCAPYESVRGKIVKSLNSYLNSDSKNKVKYKTEYTKKLNELKSLCKQSLSAADYNDACVQRCLTLEADQKLWNGEMGIKITGECGFSDNLIAWIRNIINWVKYIVPVAVIILGIIDFIKAIASEKDDQMKTAQRRFIKRLIAAALIFIIPFIIEFVLDKLGFTAEGCGIIDL